MRTTPRTYQRCTSRRRPRTAELTFLARLARLGSMEGTSSPLGRCLNYGWCARLPDVINPQEDCGSGSVPPAASPITPHILYTTTLSGLHALRLATHVRATGHPEQGDGADHVEDGRDP
jgi:hypothetical protein